MVSPFSLYRRLPLLGRTQKFSTENARTRLGYAPRPPADTVADAGRSLLQPA